MTRVTTTPLAVSADYADALLAARRAKNWMFFLLLLFLLAQITIFFLVRFDVVKLGAGADATVSVPTSVDVDAEADVDVEAPTTGESSGAAPTTGETPTTAESTPATVPSLMAFQSAAEGRADVSLNVGNKDMTGPALAWATNSIVYLGTIFSIVMAVVILLIVLIMLVGRLIGVSHSTSAFIWAVILAALLFPWQLCWGPETGSGSANYLDAQPSAHGADPERNDLRVPGVLYTWRELRRDTQDFPQEINGNAILKYARFVGFPVVALLILFMVQAKSGRAVKFALGEAEVHVDVATTDA